MYWSQKSHLTSVIDQNWNWKENLNGLKLQNAYQTVSSMQLPASCTWTCTPVDKATAISINTTGIPNTIWKWEPHWLRWGWPKEGLHKSPVLVPLHQTCSVGPCDISGTSELPIKQYGLLVHNVQHCSYALMYTTYTHYTHSHTHMHTLHTCSSSKWYFLGSLMCFFHFCWRKTSCCLRFLPLWDRWFRCKIYWERRRVSQGRRKHLSFVRAKYSVGVIHLRGDSEAADDSTLHAKHALVRGLGYSHQEFS